MGEVPLADEDLQVAIDRAARPDFQQVSKAQAKKKVLLISGPTAVGKTALSLQLARALGGEVISADSMQVYRGMDIGTAKVSLEERQDVAHHLIDVRQVHESFNVVDFFEEASRAIEHIHGKGALPIVVGGTGFYLHSLIYGPPMGPASIPSLRAQLEKDLEVKGSEALYDKLSVLDPDYASTITKNDKHKIVRALEIMATTQKKVSDFMPNHTPLDSYDFRAWFLYKPKEILYRLIDERCDQMLDLGFLEEVKELLPKGLESNSSASQAIGYRQCLEYLKGPMEPSDWDHLILNFKQASRRYAKRQFTWFRKEPLFRWLNADEMSLERCLECIAQDLT